MIAARTYFARMNEGRSVWMTEAQLIKGCKDFFISNGYDQLEENKVFDQANGSLIRFWWAPKPVISKKRLQHIFGQK